MREKRFLLSALGLVLGLGALGSAQAQEAGFYKDLKIRLGYTPKAEDHLHQSSLGYGLNLGYAAPFGKLAVELGYNYKAGDPYLQPVGDAPTGASPVNQPISGDSRRNDVQGFALRLSFQQAINEDWEWQAGLMLGGTQFKHEYVGDVQSVQWSSLDANGNPQDNSKSWRDTYSGTPEEGGMKVSPFAGVSVKVTDHSSIEINALVLNYTVLNYVHHAGSAGSYGFDPGSNGTAGRIAPHNAFPSDSLEKKNRLSPQLEFGYVFHF